MDVYFGKLSGENAKMEQHDSIEGKLRVETGLEIHTRLTNLITKSNLNNNAYSSDLLSYSSMRYISVADMRNFVNLVLDNYCTISTSDRNDLRYILED